MMSTALMTLKNDLDSRTKSLESVAKPGVDVNGLKKQIVMAASSNDDLLKCTKESLMKAAMAAAAVGLDCSGVTGLAYLVPFKSQAQLIVGWRGLQEIVLRSGQVTHLDNAAVYENDVFEFELGENPKLRHHVPNIQDRGKMIAVYAIARLKGSEFPIIEVMNRKQIEAIRDRSAAWKHKGKSSPWGTDPVEMSRKTVVRRICKRLPTMPDLEMALANDQDVLEVAAEFARRVTTDTLMKPVEKPVEIPAEATPADEPQDQTRAEARRLTKGQVKQLQAMAEKAGASWDAIQDRAGGDLTQVPVPGPDAMATVNAWINEAAGQGVIS